MQHPSHHHETTWHNLGVGQQHHEWPPKLDGLCAESITSHLLIKWVSILDPSALSSVKTKIGQAMRRGCSSEFQASDL